MIIRDLALQRMKMLYSLALDETRKGRDWLARRYIELIIKYSHKARVKPPRYIRRGYCRRCKIPLIPGLTSRIRIQSKGRRGSRIVVTCLKCGWIRRFMVKTLEKRLREG